MTQTRTKRKQAFSVLLGLLLPAITGAAVPDEFAERVLVAQNRERLATGVPPLRWNYSLAAAAQQWADHLAATGTFEHAPERQSDPEGENLWAGTKSRYSIEAMVNSWVREKHFYKPGEFPNNSTTGHIEDVGHYTQLIWRKTGQVGCAKAASAREDILVCRYSEAGNYVGDSPF